jgi:hypothetical protein
VTLQLTNQPSTTRARCAGYVASDRSALVLRAPLLHRGACILPEDWTTARRQKTVRPTQRMLRLGT